MVISVSDWWHLSDPQAWAPALEQRYWNLVKYEKQKVLERKLEPLDLEHLRNRISKFDAKEWYGFLKSEYFPWKYTDPRWLPGYLRELERQYHEHSGEFDQVRKRLLTVDVNDVGAGLNAARGATGGIRGLGVAGASGLLALMYPKTFGTVDKFVVKALKEVRNLPESAALERIAQPDNMNVVDAVLLIRIMQKKAAAINFQLQATTWTPRKVDKILWTYGHD
jgi:hypothetical protein